VHQIGWLAWTAFGVTLFAGLSMVTNAPFYSFKVVGGRRISAGSPSSGTDGGVSSLMD
jgi:hypothetical protein